MMPAIQSVDHIAIAVRPGELEGQLDKYKAIGFTEVHREEVHGAHLVREVLLRAGDGPHYLQLIEPLSPASPLAEQIERNGGRGGLAHVAFRVPDIQAAYEYFRGRGFDVIGPPGPGSRGTTIFFIHPREFGYLFEVVQHGGADD